MELKYSQEIEQTISKCIEWLNYLDKINAPCKHVYTIGTRTDCFDEKKCIYIAYHSAKQLKDMGYYVYLQFDEYHEMRNIPQFAIITKTPRKCCRFVKKLYDFTAK